MPFIKHDELELWESYKTVKVGDEWRFIKTASGVAHNEMVKKGETATAAGIVAIQPGALSILSYWSMTLKLGLTPAHLDELAALFGLPIRDSND
jgi:hypothetical protein